MQSVKVNEQKRSFEELPTLAFCILIPHEVQGHVVPVWKHPINVSLEPSLGCQGYCTT